MSILVLALLAAVPAVAVGPDTIERAAEVAAPIQEVTVFEDRAWVRRRATLSLPAGVSTWRLPELPGSIELGALRATLEGARLLRVEAQPLDRDRLLLEPAAKLVAGLEAIADAQRWNDAQRKSLDARARLLAGLAPAPLVPEAQRDGRPLPGLFADAWLRTAGALSGERAQLRTRLAKLADDRRRLDDEERIAREALSKLELGGLTDRVVRVAVVVEATQSTRAELNLEYAVPGARWRPAYELRFYAEDGRAEVASFGLVTQASGEDWSRVELGLSTALPSLDVELPRLLTWTLGEAKEWQPTVSPRERPPESPAFPPPVARTTRGELGAALDREVLLGRIAQWRSSSVEGDLDGRRDKERSPRAQAKSAPPPPPPPAPMERAEVAAELYSGVAPSMLESAPREQMVAVSSASSRRSEYSARGLALFEPPPPPVPPLDPTSPAALAGGFDHVYAVPTRFDVPSDGETHRVPLGVESQPVTTFYEATPALAPQAFLRATVSNRSSRPILGGPVGIFLGSAYSGDGTLATTGPGGNLALPLGADEDVRVSRKLVTRTTREGVFSKDDVTTYRVELEVSSAKKRPIRVVLREPLPRSGNERVKVEGVTSKPSAELKEEEGVARWSVDVAPGQVSRVELVYVIRRPSDQRLWQR